MEHLDDLLASIGVGTLDRAYRPPALERPDLRRRPVSERAAA
jgi:hypothetical protein